MGGNHKIFRSHYCINKYLDSKECTFCIIKSIILKNKKEPTNIFDYHIYKMNYIGDDNVYFFLALLLSVLTIFVFLMIIYLFNFFIITIKLRI